MRPTRSCRRWPSRTGRAAACSGCIAGRAWARTARRPGSRSAGRARRRAGTRARRTPSTSGSAIRVSSLGVEQAKVDPLGDLAEQREVGAGSVVCGAEGIRLCPARSASPQPARAGPRRSQRVEEAERRTSRVGHACSRRATGTGGRRAPPDGTVAPLGPGRTWTPVGRAGSTRARRGPGPNHPWLRCPATAAAREADHEHRGGDDQRHERHVGAPVRIDPRLTGRPPGSAGTA